MLMRLFRSVAIPKQIDFKETFENPATVAEDKKSDTRAESFA